MTTKRSTRPGHYWEWADAAARIAETVDASQENWKGWQADMSRAYKLVSASPVRWAPVDDETMGEPLILSAAPGSSSLVSLGISQSTSGTLAARSASGTTRSSNLPRVALNTSASTGQTTQVRQAGGTLCLLPSLGFRAVFRCVLGAPSTSWRWFMGIGANQVASGDVNNFTSCIGIGRGNGESNAKRYNNDGSGTANGTDLGANFPAATVDKGVELELYTYDGTSYGCQARALDVENSDVSWTLSSDLPSAAALISLLFTAGNNSDAQVISQDFSIAKLYQRLR